MSPSVLVVDTYYSEFLSGWDFNPAATYESELQRLLHFFFGTGDGYSRNLRALGWEAFDIIQNCEHFAAFDKTLPSLKGIPDCDVIFMQDLSVPRDFRRPRVLAGQCSCPWPGDSNIAEFDVIFTSFPHYIPRIEALGVKAVYNPLAFDPIVLNRVANSSNGICSCGYSGLMGHECSECGNLYSKPDEYLERPYDVVFIGGVGAPSHWRRGMETLNAVAETIPTFKWWGYGAELLPKSSALWKAYQGEAWGLDMYRILLQSKIVLNRHGEVAEGYANNMRMFEATGCGAMLLTEDAPNLSDFFIESNGVNDKPEVVAYESAEEAVDLIEHFLFDGPMGGEYNPMIAEIAKNGQARTLRDHTYAQRMKTVSDTLKGML